MHLYPTRPTLHVALAGTVMITLGVALHRPPAVAFGGAILLAMALGRGLSLLSGTRLRHAGFEMVWAQGPRVAHVARGETTVLEVDLKNRSKDPVRVVALRGIASSLLDVVVTPNDVDLPPKSSIKVLVRTVGMRVGRWGLHGLALELRGMPLGGEGLYEVPLVFSNPFGVEVLPAPLATMLRSPRGGRSGRVTEAGRTARTRGEGDELRELRDHVPGDAFKKIAWRASARRGRLVVREMERQERDIVWLVVDVSVDGWAGAPGSAPLDKAVDEVAGVATRHLARGDRVGLITFASRPRAWIPLGQGPAQAALIATTLAGSSNMVDADRTEDGEHEVALRVVEHMRPLVRTEVEEPKTSDLDRLAIMSETVRASAPFEARLPYAATPRERALRHYLACFGIEVPPRSLGERRSAESELVRALTKLGLEKPQPTVIAVWAPAPSPHGLIARAVRKLRARRTDLRWTVPDLLASLGSPTEGAEGRPKVAESIDEAVRVRVRAERLRAAAALRALGIESRKA